MELHQIKSFVMVARTRNLTRAAARLNTTPPSVSAHIRRLEEEFNVALFQRTPKGMTLTAHGKALEQKAGEILSAAQAFSTAARNAGGQIAGTLKLGINADPEYLKIQEIVHFLFRNHPGLSLSAAALNTREILRQVSREEIDLGYVFGTHERTGLEFRDLARVDLEIVVPVRFEKSHGNAGWKEIADLPWIQPVSLCPFLDQVTALLTAKGIGLARPVASDDDITRTALINQGIAATVLERSEARAFEKQGKVFIWNNHDPISTRLSLVYPASSRDIPGIRLLAGLIERLWHSSGEGT